MIMFKITTLAVLAAIITIPSAIAAETDWVEIGPNARLRMIANNAVSNGQTMVAIEVDMPANMKTYWRIPGETGIPIQLDFSKSQGISAHDIQWPYPLREAKDGFIDFVYYGPTTLPVSLTTDGTAARIDVNIFMGICADICVPVQADVSLPLDFSKTDRANDLRIKQALADVPIIAADEGLIGQVEVAPDADHLSVAFDRNKVDPRSIIIDVQDPTILFSLPEISPAHDAVTFAPLGNTDLAALGDAKLRVTFLTADGAFEIDRSIKTHGAD